MVFNGEGFLLHYFRDATFYFFSSNLMPVVPYFSNQLVYGFDNFSQPPRFLNPFLNELKLGKQRWFNPLQGIC